MLFITKLSKLTDDPLARNELTINVLLRVLLCGVLVHGDVNVAPVRGSMVSPHPPSHTNPSPTHSNSPTDCPWWMSSRSTFWGVGPMTPPRAMQHSAKRWRGRKAGVSQPSYHSCCDVPQGSSLSVDFTSRSMCCCRRYSRAVITGWIWWVGLGIICCYDNRYSRAHLADRFCCGF